MIRWISGIVSFTFVFAGVFFLGGWFLMPHLPPAPNHPVHFFEPEFWTTNWIGVVLGIPLGLLSGRGAMRRKHG